MSSATAPTLSDPVSNVLKWILLVVAVLSFALMGWSTQQTYQGAPGIPQRFADANGATLMTGDEIVAGKAGFQKADLMDFGSLYGMGSYYGGDYTADSLHRLAVSMQDRLAQQAFAKPFAALGAAEQAAVTQDMRGALQGIDLTRAEVTIPPALAASIVAERDQLTAYLQRADQAAGWVPAYSLTPNEARATADFIIYWALTTVARRPGTTVSWTQNWPSEPLVGNVPTPSTFLWTWISFCFTFFCFGLVLFIYEYWLNRPDDAPMETVLSRFAPLTPSQRKVGKYFLIVAAVLLLQIAAGTIMAHLYYDRTGFYGWDINVVFPFNFLRDVHLQAPIIWIGLSRIGAALFLAPAIAGQQEARGQRLPVDTTLFWQWMRLPGDVLFAVGALLMAWDFVIKLGPLYPMLERSLGGAARTPSAAE